MWGSHYGEVTNYWDGVLSFRSCGCSQKLDWCASNLASTRPDGRDCVAMVVNLEDGGQQILHADADSDTITKTVVAVLGEHLVVAQLDCPNDMEQVLMIQVFSCGGHQGFKQVDKWSSSFWSTYDSEAWDICPVREELAVFVLPIPTSLVLTPLSTCSR